MENKLIKTLMLCAATIIPVAAIACGPDPADYRTHVFRYDRGNTFDEYFYEANKGFWANYCDTDYWVSSNDRKEAAEKKNDSEMLSYLQQLDKYENISRQLRNDWSYPTSEELRERKQTLNNMITEARANKKGKYGDRWLLLEMRANMLLGNYQDNITLWENEGVNMPDSYVRDMMLNVYGNALLHTGKTKKAWEVYANQNDEQSVLFSVRNYANLSGLKVMYETDPGSKAMEYLLAYYVDYVQDVLEKYYWHLQQYGDSNNSDFIRKSERAGYADMDKDFMKEINEFVSFAEEVSKNSATLNPSLWLTASALVSYYLNDFTGAKNRIDRAMKKPAEQPMKDMTRRVRMLIYTGSEDIDSKEFQKFMADELRWLDGEVNKEAYYALYCRNRILFMGLMDALSDSDDEYLEATINLTPNNELYYRLTDNQKAFCEDHLSDGFSWIFNQDADKIVDYFNWMKSVDPRQEPLAAYFIELNAPSADYINDVIGTKYLSELKFEKAKEYLEQVPIDYLNRQAIRPYACCRSYEQPSWIVNIPGEYFDSYKHVKRNIKLDFCNDMIRLYGEYGASEGEKRKGLAYEIGTLLFEATPFGNCWFITRYGTGTFNVISQKDDNEMYLEAINKLLEAAESNDGYIRNSALFCLCNLSEYRGFFVFDDFIKDNPQYGIKDNSGATDWAWNKILDSGYDEVPEFVTRCDVYRWRLKSRS